MQTLSRHFATLRTLLRMPVAALRFDSTIEPVNVVSTYRYYTKPHPKYKIIQNKRWGAALIDLRQCPTRDAYFERIKGKNNGAWHARRAKRGLRDAQDRPQRPHRCDPRDQQLGRPAPGAYRWMPVTRKSRPVSMCSPTSATTACSTAQGKLVAYANIGRYGNFCAFSQLIGYRNNDGIMHLLITDIVA
ncbi:hypothetical protein LP420_03155 [Massilia sp. B-10]|nr:hypothetical protein LP420_03155 [Massilia sp. B-10]